MQARYTCLWIFLIGILWTTNVFAYVLGPDPAMNGIFPANGACNVAGCHTSFALNLPNGSVSVGGLPTTGWVPGQTYALTVTITGPATQRIFGFQLSAVADATNQQAGTLTAGNARVQIICGRGTAATSTQQVSCTTAGSIQYAEHSNAQILTNPYLVNWTAPLSASVGTIRFNVAGNAANGDLTNQNDYIYTNVYRIGALDLSVRAFTMVDRGGVSLLTDGSGGLNAGYARILPNSGSTPSGVAIFGERTGGVLVTEAGVPASPLIKNGRIYAEVGPGGANGQGTDIGLAIANPTSQDANISFTFTDINGVDVLSGNDILPATTQIAGFLDQSPWNGPLGFRGTFSFTSSVNVSVVALEGYRNQRTPSDFLITTLPVIDLDTTTVSASPALLPYYTDGAGWSTYILLVNPTSTTMTGKIQFRTAHGAAQLLSANGQTAQSYSYTVKPKSSFKLTTAGTSTNGPAPNTGPVSITPDSGTSTPVPLVVFSFAAGGITLTQAGVPANSGTSFRMFVEAIPGTPTGIVGSYSSGFAIANSGSADLTVNLELTSLAGTAVSSTTITVPGLGVAPQFLENVFPSLPLPFQGTLRISSTSSNISVVGLRIRYNERDEFLMTTTPPTNENTTTPNAEFDFPHILNGGGYTTQFVLFSGSAGQTSAGNLQFYTQGGKAFSLNLN